MSHVHNGIVSQSFYGFGTEDTTYASRIDYYSAEGCGVKCAVMYPKIPCLWNCSKRPSKSCCVHNKRAETNRTTCKRNCEATGAGGILGTGIGSGRRKACKEIGLSKAEKRECARELRARGWKKGQPIPDDMMGIIPEDVEQLEKEEPVSAEEGKMVSDTTKKALIYAGIAVGSIAGISLLIWGISGAFKKQSP